jgi:hypothetical protein
LPPHDHHSCLVQVAKKYTEPFQHSNPDAAFHYLRLLQGYSGDGVSDEQRLEQAMVQHIC